MNSSNFSKPTDNRYFEDYIPGAVHEFGSIAVDEEEVLEFGKRYVPLSYHVDKESAKNSIYGGLIASGKLGVAGMRRIALVQTGISGRRASGARDGSRSAHFTV